MRKKLVAGLLSAIMVLQTPFAALAAEPVDSAGKAKVTWAEQTLELAGEADAEEVTALGAEAEVFAAGSKDEIAKVASAENSSVVVPLDEMVDKNFFNGDEITLYFNLFCSGDATDRYHVEIYKGEVPTAGNKVADGHWSFGDRNTITGTKLSVSSAGWSTGTYSVRFWQTYSQNNEDVVAGKIWYIPIHIVNERVPIESITLDTTGLQIPEGYGIVVYADVLPANTTEDNVVEWASTNYDAIDLTISTADWAEDTLYTSWAVVAGAEGNGLATVTATAGSKSAIAKFACSPAEDKDFPFSDILIETGNWKYDNVKYVYENEIMKGIAGTAWFNPDDNLKREMVAAILYRMAGSPEVTFDAEKFSDVTNAGAYFANAVIWASEKAIVKGYDDGTFGVGRDITRSELAKMLKGYAASQGYDVTQTASLDSFVDKDDAQDWRGESLGWAVAVGLMSGKPVGDGTFRLDTEGNATRAESAKMVALLDQYYE